MNALEKLHQAWKLLSKLPFGKSIFSSLVGFFVPYSGSIGARIEELRPGYAKLLLRDRRKVRNHLQSVHAIALMNLGELCSGLAFNLGLPKGMRGIVTKLEIEFYKKSRGLLTAICDCDCPETHEEAVKTVEALIYNEEKVLCAKVIAHWKVGS